MMSPLQIERSLSVHSGTTGKDFFIFEKVVGGKMIVRKTEKKPILLVTSYSEQFKLFRKL